MTEQYQRFLPQQGDDGCASFLPLNTITSRIALYDITLFETTLDAVPDVTPIKPIYLLSLQLNAINPLLAELVQTQSVELENTFLTRILTSYGQTFLPAPGDDALAKLTVEKIRVKAPGEEVKYAGEKLELSRGELVNLNEKGEIYTRSKKTGQVIRVEVESLPVFAELIDLKRDRAIIRLQDGREIELDAEKSRILRDTGQVFDEIETNNRRQYTTLRLVRPGTLIRPAPRGPRSTPPRTPLSTNSQPLSEGEDIGTLKTPASPIPLPRYPIGIMTTYEQSWELLGYSRGALLSSITLAPGEDVTMEVFTWDRQKIEREQQFGAEYATNRELSSMRRASADVAHDLTTQLGAKAGITGGLSIPIKSVNLNLGTNAEVSQQVQEGVKFQVNDIHEASVRASENYKVTHQVKITQTNETGVETRTTRNFSNGNVGRTLTLNHYEIMENYHVTTLPTSSKRWVLLVENPDMGPFDLDFIMAYEYRLQEVLLHANYRRGFEAARIKKAHEWFLDSRQRAEQEAPKLGETPDQAGTANNSIPRRGIFATAYNIAEILESFIDLLDRIDEAVNALAAAQLAPMYNLDVPISAEELRQYQADVAKYSYWIKINQVIPGFEERARNYLGSGNGRIKTLFNNRANEDEVVRRLALLIDNVDNDFVHTLKMLAASYVVNIMLNMLSTALITAFFTSVPGGVALVFPAVHLIGPILFPVISAIAFTHDDGGLSKAISRAKRQYTTFGMQQEAETLLPEVAPDQEIPVVPAQPPVPQVYTDRELAEAHADFEKLVTHLEAHRTYYQNEIWRVEDSNQRFERLQAMGIAEFIDNRLLGFNGNGAIYPLRLYTLPESTADALEQFHKEFALEKIEAQSFNTALPTAGTHMEGILGQCDALEPYMTARRELEVERARIQNEILREQLERKRLEAQQIRLNLEQTATKTESPQDNRTTDEDND